MTEHNKNETQKLDDGARWVIRQLLFDTEQRNVEIELYDAEPNGYVVYYHLISGNDAVVKEYAQKLGIQIQANRLEVQHG